MVCIAIGLSGCPSGSYTVRSFTDRHSYTVGDKIHYYIDAKLPQDAAVLPIDPGFLKGFTILESWSRQKQGILGRHFTQHYIITRYETGDYTIPQANFSYVVDAQKKNISTNPVILTITDIPVRIGDAKTGVKIGGNIRGASEEGFRKIDAPIRLKIDDELVPVSVIGGNDIFLAAGILSAIVLFLIAVLAILRKKHAKKIVPVSGKDRLMERLKILSEWKGDGAQLKQAAFEFSRELKIYLNEFLKLDTSEVTSSEFIKRLKESNPSGDLSKVSEDIIVFCDLVKYSGRIPSQEELADIIEQSKGLVDAVERQKTVTEEKR